MPFIIAPPSHIHSHKPFTKNIYTAPHVFSWADSGAGVQPGGGDWDGEDVEARGEREESVRRGAGDRWGAERGDGSRGRWGERQMHQVRTLIYLSNFRDLGTFILF